jgi:glucose-1-phosphate adenylyltransferase
MEGRRVLAFVLAGGRSSRLRPLCALDPKPTLPLAGRRLIDFTLSNLVNSGVGEIYVLAQCRSRSIVEHVEEVWAPLLRRSGGLAGVILPCDAADGAFLGTADAVYENLDIVHRRGPDLVAVFGGGQVYRMDVGQMAAFHARSVAAVTVAAVRVPMNEARTFGGIVAGPDGSIGSIDDGRAPTSLLRPAIAYASMGNYLFDPGALIELLTQAHLQGEADLERHVLPRASRSHRAFVYDFSQNCVPGLLAWEEPGYWRDVATIDAYRAAQEDTRGLQPRFSVANAFWPIHGGRPHFVPPQRECVEWPAGAGTLHVGCSPPMMGLWHDG